MPSQHGRLARCRQRSGRYVWSQADALRAEWQRYEAELRATRGIIAESDGFGLRVTGPDAVELVCPDGSTFPFSPAASAALLGPWDRTRVRALHCAAMDGAAAAVAFIESCYASKPKVRLPPPVRGRDYYTKKREREPRGLRQRYAEGPVRTSSSTLRRRPVKSKVSAPPVRALAKGRERRTPQTGQPHRRATQSACAARQSAGDDGGDGPGSDPEPDTERRSGPEPPRASPSTTAAGPPALKLPKRLGVNQQSVAEALHAAPDGLTFADLRRELGGINHGSLVRTLKSLVKRGVVEEEREYPPDQRPRNRYRLSRKLHVKDAIAPNKAASHHITGATASNGDGSRGGVDGRAGGIARKRAGPKRAGAGASAQTKAPPRTADPRYEWLTYTEAAAYCRWTVAYLRNLVSSGLIPVYGRPRSRRFRRDMLDLYLTDPDAAMRRFRAERDAHGG